MNLKILTYNIHKGLSSLGVKDTLKLIKTKIEQTQVNLCFLQEVVGSHQNLETGQFEYLADTLWPYFSYGKNASYPKGDHGNAILSSFPIVSEYNLDLTLHKYEQRGLLHTMIENPENQKKLHLLNTHLNLRSKDRLVQIEKIHQYVEESIPKEDGILFCGDLNDWNQKVHQYLVSKAHFSVAGDNLFKSFPSFFPMVSLDRIYYRKLKVNSCTVLKDKSWTDLSDHLPIIAEVVL